MANIINRIDSIQAKQKVDKPFEDTNPLGLTSAPLTLEATQPLEKEEKKDVAKAALEDPDFRNWFEEQKKEINKRFDAKEKATQKKQLIETLTNAVTQFGAAVSGQKSGVDLSNLNLIKQDFEKELDRASHRRESEESGLRQELGARRRLAELVKGRKERKAEREEDVAFREKKLDISTKQAEARAQAAKVKASGKPFRDFSTRTGDIVRVFLDGTTWELRKGKAGAIQASRLGLQKEKFAHKVQEGDEPSAKQIEELTGLDETVGLLKKIRDKKESEGIDTGPIADIQNKLARVIGIDDPKVSTLRQDLVETLTKKVKNLSGAAASDTERKTIMKTLPNMDDNDEQFMAKIDNALKTIDLIKETKITGLEKGGRTVSQVRDQPNVSMVAPDGRELSVPEDKVEAMEAPGATRK